MKQFLAFLTQLLNLLYASKKELDIDKKETIMKAPKLDISSIQFHDFPENQFVKRISEKTQVALHHTVSGKGVEGDIGWWLSQPQRIATHFIVDWTGKIHQNYSTKYWGYHLGCGNAKLDACTIAIEIDSWGGLMQDDKGSWRPARRDKKTGKYLPDKRIKGLSDDRILLLDEPYRGFKAYEKYTDAAIESLRRLLVYCNEKYGIPINYDERIWDYFSAAVDGVPGVYSHTSYRKDKSDVYPCPRLIEMLKNPYKKVA